MQPMTPASLLLNRYAPHPDGERGLYCFSDQTWLLDARLDPLASESIFSQASALLQESEHLALPTQSLAQVYDLLLGHRELQLTLAEYQRILHPGGQVACYSLTVPPSPKAARYLTLLWRLHHQDYQRAYSTNDWQFFLEMGGWQAVQIIPQPQALTFAEWMASSSLRQPAMIERLAAMLLHAPSEVQDWLGVEHQSHLGPLLGLRLRLPYQVILAKRS